MRIKDISKNERPRERLERLGPTALSDAEILSLVLQKGTKYENVIDLSNKILAKHEFSGLAEVSLKELQNIRGIGKAKACQIIALFEFEKRYKSSKAKQNIKCARDVFNYLKPKIGHKNQELFVILLLDSKNNILRDEVISIGTLTSSLIHPREVFKPAIKESANSIIVAHNHPSGDPTPSKEDIKITKLLEKASLIINIGLLDHIIVGKESYYSFKEKGKLK